MAYKLLLVEDDKQIREIIVDYFTDIQRENPFEVFTAKDGRIAEEKLDEREYDLIFLDVMLPGIDGFSLCRKIRKHSDVPVIFLTARTMEEDILLGFETGCDDYITKPFSLKTLYAKSIALLNRAKGTVSSKNLTVGAITVSEEEMRATAGEEEVVLAPKEFELLLYLMNHKNMVLSRERLLNAVWGYEYEGGDRVVDNHIKKLHKALGTAGGQIKTVISKGYKLTE